MDCIELDQKNFLEDFSLDNHIKNRDQGSPLDSTPIQPGQSNVDRVFSGHYSDAQWLLETIR